MDYRIIGFMECFSTGVTIINALKLITVYDFKGH